MSRLTTHALAVVALSASMIIQAQNASPTASYALEKAQEGLVRLEELHQGKGAIDMKFFFTSERYAFPAFLMIYTMGPGASEGVHTHGPESEELGSFDEFYYVLSGKGEMEIGGKKVPVAEGDQVFAPNGVAHGIENTSEKPLKVYIVAIARTESA